MRLEDKLDQLKEYFRGRKVIIAFSGGADSTLLAKIAQDYSAEALAVTVNNGVMPSGFNDNARKIAHQVGINHLVIEEDLIKNPNFVSNSPMRCFLCKNNIHGKIGKILKEKGF